MIDERDIFSITKKLFLALIVVTILLMFMPVNPYITEPCYPHIYLRTTTDWLVFYLYIIFQLLIIFCLSFAIIYLWAVMRKRGEKNDQNH